MKKTIRELIKKPNANRKVLQKVLKREIKVLYIMGKFPPRFYDYQMMLKHINATIFFPEIFNGEILDKEFEVEEE